MTAVLRAARASPLRHDVRSRKSTFNVETGEYVSKRIKKQIHLQTTLQCDPSPYDYAWVGDEMQNPDDKMIRFWLQMLMASSRRTLCKNSSMTWRIWQTKILITSH